MAPYQSWNQQPCAVAPVDGERPGGPPHGPSSGRHHRERPGRSGSHTVAAAATVGEHLPGTVRLSRPTHIRLAPEQLQALDRWRGDRMSRATAIRLLLDQALRLHLNGILPPTTTHDS